MCVCTCIGVHIFVYMHAQARGSLQVLSSSIFLYFSKAGSLAKPGASLLWGEPISANLTQGLQINCHKLEAGNLNMGPYTVHKVFCSVSCLPYPYNIVLKLSISLRIVYS